MNCPFFPILRALLCASFLLLGAAAPAFAQVVSGKVTLVVGSVEYSAPGTNTFSAVRRGDVLPVGTTIRTGAAARAVVVAGPGAAVRVGPETTLELSKLALEQALAGAVGANDILIDVKQGSMSALIDRQKQPGANFQVRTPQGVAAARGTIYAVAVEGNRSYAKVLRGTVRIANYSAAGGTR